MRILYLYILSLYLLIEAAPQQPKANVINFISNFFSNEIFPVRLNAFICWNYKHTINLVRTLANINVPVSIQNIEIPYYKNSIDSIMEKEDQFYLVDSVCPYSQNIFQMADNTGRFMFPYRWLILNECQFELNLNSYFFPVSSRVYILNYCSMEADLISIYQVQRNNSILNNHLGFWKSERGFEIAKRISDFNDRRNLLKMRFNVTMVFTDNKTIDTLHEIRRTKNDAVGRHSYALVKYVAEMFNVIPNIIIRNSWGYKNETTNKYTNFYGDLQSELCEYGGVPDFQSADRYDFLEYIGEPVYTYGMFYILAPPLSTIANIYTLPFALDVWYATYGFLAIFYVCLYIIVKWEMTRPEDSYGDAQHLEARVTDVLQMQVGAIFQQGSEAEPRSASGKMASFLIFLSLMFIFTAYSANIVALLQSTSNNIDSLQDLLNYNVELGVEDNVYDKHLFSNQPSEIHKEIARKIRYYNLTYGVKKFRTDFFAFHVEPTNIFYEIAQTFQASETCGINKIIYWKRQPWLAARKTSHYKELLRAAYAKLVENGIRKRHEKLYLSAKPVCTDQGSNFVSVGISDCYFASLCYMIGLTIAVIIIFIETLFAKNFIKISLSK